MANLVLRMQYRGDERTTELPLTQDMITQLAFEAQVRDMSIGELVSELIILITKKDLFQKMLTVGGELLRQLRDRAILLIGFASAMPLV